ncbi:TetR/AcrR family transcriptional regulator C-terminal domain-containing protein, partial [Escherichia coli]|uniref:TetR/AcrR family transcriptional regulator C-terminal domain-containing protein n=1 Tax=Escherichia coli TaxID=562 RepID=UPI00203F2946
DRNRSHWSTSKTPSYTKSVSWQHHPLSAVGHFTLGCVLEDQEHQVAKEERETPTTDSMPPLLRQAIELFDHQGAEPAFLFGLELIICGLEKQLKCESGS